MKLGPARFFLESPFQPGGDQPQAISDLVKNFKDEAKFQTLLGVTGSGKTFTMAHVIAELGLPTLILSPNKTLVSQLYQEFKSFFPRNAVEYFVSYYDYYQPEAYLPVTDTYIEKDSSINEEIEKLRLRSTASLMSRKDVIVLASVSCIYGLGSPKDYADLMAHASVGLHCDRDEFLRKLIDIQYTRNDLVVERGCFRVRGDRVEIRPAYDDWAFRIEWFGDEIESITQVDLMQGKDLASLESIAIYPAKHYVTREENTDRIVRDIKTELKARLEVLRSQGKLVEAQRLESRCKYDMEMLEETGFCSGVENYSRIIDNRAAGTPPFTLLDFFGDDYLLIIDESHASIPQVRGMYGGDRSRKETLVEYGFRLPSALDNRPLNLVEFEERLPKTLFVSATPADYELQKSQGLIVEQIVRPTGLVDPIIEVRPIKGQLDNLMHEIQLRIAKKERTLVLTLTKKSAEDLTEFLHEAGLKVLYIHSDTDTLKRTEILQSLREGEIDVLVGINLLREGLDLPEVSLVAILDADKEGFLRNYRTLIQIAGRAARNVNGLVIFYADQMTASMRTTIEETDRRREKQVQYNLEHGITPQTIIKEIRQSVKIEDLPREISKLEEKSKQQIYDPYASKTILELEREMLEAAERLDFETAAILRDKIKSMSK